MYNKLSNKVADLREVFPWPKECNNFETKVEEPLPYYNDGEIVHSPEMCLDVMIRISKYLALKQKAFEHAFKELEVHYPRIAEDFDSDRLGFIQNHSFKE